MKNVRSFQESLRTTQVIFFKEKYKDVLKSISPRGVYSRTVCKKWKVPGEEKSETSCDRRICCPAVGCSSYIYLSFATKSNEYTPVFLCGTLFCAVLWFLNHLLLGYLYFSRAAEFQFNYSNALNVFCFWLACLSFVTLWRNKSPMSIIYLKVSLTSLFFKSFFQFSILYNYYLNNLNTPILCFTFLKECF